jgi:signal transduction histidine kinase
MKPLSADFLPRSETLRWVAWSGLLGAAAIVADLFAPVIFAGHTLVLGVVFYWVALRLLGPNRALLVLAAGTITLAFKWGQPYSGSIIALEGLWVGWAWRRRYNPLLADVLFWIVVGTPLSWFLYRHVYVIPRPSLDHALAVQPINGFIAVWIAYLLLEQFRSPGSLAEPAPVQDFRSVLVKRYVAFGTFPVLAVGLIAMRNFEQRALSEARDNLRTTALQLASEIEAQIATSAAAVREFAARQAEPASFSADADLETELNRLHQRTGSLVTMLAANDSGQVIAVAPALANRVRATRVDDREYFTVPMKTGLPHISGVFRGRGFGSDLLIAVSAPAISRTGNRLGVVEGSFKVNALAATMQRGLPSESLRALLADGQMHVIAHQGFEYLPLNNLKGTAIGNHIERLEKQPVRLTTDRQGDRVSYLSLTVPLPNLGWTLTIQREWRDVLRPIIVAHAWSLLIAIATAVIASLFATWSLRDFLRAWRDLIAFSRAPSVQSNLLEDSARLDLPLEFRELLQNLYRMAQRLESETQQREDLLLKLESRVRERTRDLERALVQAQSADRAKSAFFATVSHELRTPLTSIITGARLLQLSSSQRNDMETRTLATLEKSGHVLMSVISDVLDYSKLEAGGLVVEAAPFRPAEVIADVTAILDPAAIRGTIALHCETRFPADLVWVGDMQRVKQVLLNLAGNAIKFTPAGSVTIASWLHADTSDGVSRLHFAVTDTGPGIPQDRLDSIFQPFVQLETNRVTSKAGTGLGLSICRRLVELMGGKITATSELGQGSNFEFWVPARPMPESTGPDRSNSSPQKE